MAKKLKRKVSGKIVRKVVKEQAERPQLGDQIVLGDLFPKAQDRTDFRNRLSKYIAIEGFKIAIKHIPTDPKVTLRKVTKALTTFSLPGEVMAELPGAIRVPRPKKKKRDSDA